MSKSQINIVWFKRDLRLNDHEPLKLASEQNLPVLFLYCFEPSLINQPDSNPRHWRFCYESLLDLNKALAAFNLKIEIFYEDFPVVLSYLLNHYHIKSIFSHAEHGNLASYNRDKTVSKICKTEQIYWHESQTFGVVRGMKNRINWFRKWNQTMLAKWFEPNLNNLIKVELLDALGSTLKNESYLPAEITTRDKNFQPGGESKAYQYLYSFLNERVSNYQKGISKPVKSRTSCSRISPYLAYGCISLKQVYQLALGAKEKYPKNKRNFDAFISRLHWHCHFIQKFETEHEIEFRNFNRAFDSLNRMFNEQYHQKFITGQTGYPMVDANVRCLIATGYINFRMRAMLVAFYTFNLWMPWQPLAIFLANNFLDYEPGIHYPQIQMQAGTTGIHLLRMYNVITQAEKHDPDNEFILRWIPELKKLPSEFVQKPWLLTKMEAELYGFNPEKDYPLPMVDIEKTTKNTRDSFAEILHSEACKKENERILLKHVRLKITQMEEDD